MRAVRFGSYSIAATLAGMPSLSRLKSMMRYIRLWPPPRKRAVMRPCELRPPVFLSGSSSDFSGSVFVISSKVATVMPRRAGDVGLYRLTPMVHPASSISGTLEDRDPLALCQGHDGLLDLPRAALRPALPAQLALLPDGVHLGDLHVEDLLDRLLNLRLVGVAVDFEHVLALLHQGSSLLGNNRPLQNVSRVHQPNASSSLATASLVRTSFSCDSTA